MTANELLSLLGRAWSRLLIYPGGLTAFGLVWLVFTLLQRFPFNKVSPPPSRTPAPPHPRTLAGSAIILPWLALALLPLPLAVALPRQIDIVVALALLEWPNLLAIRQNLRAGNMRRLAAALNSYPSLILASLALMQAGNSLELMALARAPGDLTSSSASALHWLGGIALALALPAALGLGPFADEGRRTNDDGRPSEHFNRAQLVSIRVSATRFIAVDAIKIGLWLRALGLVLLAALPWAGVENTGLALLRLIGAAALIAALLSGFDRLTRGQAAQRWALAYLALDAALLLALLWQAYQALQSRLA